MAGIWANLPAAGAQLLMDRLTAMANQCCDHDARTMDQRRADALVELAAGGSPASRSPSNRTSRSPSPCRRCWSWTTSPANWPATAPSPPPWPANWRPTRPAPGAGWSPTTTASSSTPAAAATAHPHPCVATSKPATRPAASPTATNQQPEPTPTTSGLGSSGRDERTQPAVAVQTPPPHQARRRLAGDPNRPRRNPLDQPDRQDVHPRRGHVRRPRPATLLTAARQRRTSERWQRKVGRGRAGSPPAARPPRFLGGRARTTAPPGPSSATTHAPRKNQQHQPAATSA